MSTKVICKYQQLRDENYLGAGVWTLKHMQSQQFLEFPYSHLILRFTVNLLFLYFLDNKGIY